MIKIQVEVIENKERAKGAEYFLLRRSVTILITKLYGVYESEVTYDSKSSDPMISSHQITIFQPEARM